MADTEITALQVANNCELMLRAEGTRWAQMIRGEFATLRQELKDHIDKRLTEQQKGNK